MEAQLWNEFLLPSPCILFAATGCGPDFFFHVCCCNTMLDWLWPERTLHSAPFLLWQTTVCTQLIQSTLCSLAVFFMLPLPFLAFPLKALSPFNNICTIFKCFWLYSSSSLFPLVSCSSSFATSCFSNVSLSLLFSKSCQDLLLPPRCCTARSAKATCYYVGISQPWREGLHCATGEAEPIPNKSSSILLPFRDQFILLQPSAELKALSLKAVRRHRGFWRSYE